MEIGLIPIVLIVGLILFSSPPTKPVTDQNSPKLNIASQPHDNSTKTCSTSSPALYNIAKKPSTPTLNAYHNPSTSAYSHLSHIDFHTIFHYIQSIYQRITKEDAHQIAKYIVQYGQEYELDPKLITALIAKESAFNKTAISRTGAKGLGQIKNFNFKSLDITDPYDIKQNIQGTVKYLKKMHSLWRHKNQDEKQKLALASYFQGFTNIKNRLKKTNGKLTQDAKNYTRDILEKYKDILLIQQNLH